MKKSKKRSYKSTLLILLLTAILLVVSSYAWFTSNRTVTVNTITVNVGAVNGLQISTNASDWKTFITNEDITNHTGYSAAVNVLPSNTMKPVSSALSTDSSNGRMNMYYGNVEADSTGAYVISTTKQDDGSQQYYIVFDMFLKVDSAAPVYLTTSSGVTGSSAEDVARGLQNASRIAFVKEGNVTSGSANATASAQGLKEASKVILWEPNNNVHTQASIAHAYDTYGKTITSAQVFDSYPGVNAVLSNKALTYVDSASNEGIETVTPTIKTGSNMGSYVKFDELSAGITKYRVYMWIEGQDYDCQNSASGSDLKFDLQFSLDNSATP